MSSLVKPINSSWCGGTPRELATARFKVKTVTNLRRGVFVIKDTTDDEVQAAGAGAANVIGVLDRNLTNPEWDPTTAPAIGDDVEIILLGSGAWASVRNGANLGAGVTISTSATGRAAAAVTAAAGDFQKMVGRTLMDHDGSGAEGDIVVVL